MFEGDRSRDDPRRHSPFATGGLNARLQSLLSAVLPVVGMPAVRPTKVGNAVMAGTDPKSNLHLGLRNRQTTRHLKSHLVTRFLIGNEKRETRCLTIDRTFP